MVDIEASYKSMPGISYSKYDQAYTSTQKHDRKSWARCRRRSFCIRRQDRDSRETYWKSTRHTECLGCYRSCNGRESGGRIPLNTQEQVPWCLSTERHEVTGESSNHAGKVRQWEVTKESPPDHESDQEDKEDKESLSEVNWKADQMEFIKEFQEIMNQAIDQLLKKSARRHSHRKDKPEPHMEQGKCKEAICKKAEMLPPRNISRESEDEWNSRASLEKMDTDQCIQKLVRTELEGSEHADRKSTRLNSVTR